MAYSTAITNITQALTVSWLAGGSMSFAGGALAVSPAVRTSGTASYFTVTAPADTGITTATESVGVSFTGATRTWIDGTVSVQREYVIAAPTYNKTTTSATFTKAATLAITGAPIAGTGVTISNGYSLWVQGGNTQFDGTVQIYQSGSTNNFSVATNPTALLISQYYPNYTGAGGTYSQYYGTYLSSTNVQATNATTYTNAATLYVIAPQAYTNVTFTNLAWGIMVDNMAALKIFTNSAQLANFGTYLSSQRTNTFSSACIVATGAADKNKNARIGVVSALAESSYGSYNDGLAAIWGAQSALNGFSNTLASTSVYQGAIHGEINTVTGTTISNAIVFMAQLNATTASSGGTITTAAHYATNNILMTGGSVGTYIGFWMQGGGVASSITPTTTYGVKIDALQGTTKWGIYVVSDQSYFGGNVVSATGIGWGVTSTATAAGTTTLTSSSTVIQVFTGSTTQTIQLPAANLLGSNISVIYVIKNRSSGNLTVQRAGSDTIEGATTYTVVSGNSITIASNSSSEWEII